MEIVQKVRALSEEELHARYHHLVDERFERPLKYTERFELERIEARFEAEAQDDLARVNATHETWERDRTELLISLEKLLADLRAAR